MRAVSIHPQTRLPAAHPTVLEAFHALEDTGLPWVLLRGENDLACPDGDVDLLVDPRMLHQLDGLMARIGLCRVHATGHGSHRFYFGYMDADEFWLKLDVVSEVSFGRFQQWSTPLAAGCLDRRVRQDGLWLPEPADKAWLHLLHLVLDKGAIAADRQAAALASAAVASTAGPVAEYVDRRSGDGAASALLEAVNAGNFDGARDLAGRWRRAWTRTQPLASRGRWLGHRTLRLMTPRLPGPGPVVGVMAPDGAGKTTLLHGLRADFPIPTSYVYMGLWGAGPWDRWLERLPGGRTAKKMFRVLKGGTKARYHSLRGRVVLMDRVAYDALLPQVGGGHTSAGLTNTLAVKLGPAPDVLLVLDAPGEVMFARKGEHTVELLEHWRKSYLELAARLPGARVIDAGLPRELVRRLATETVWNSISSRTLPPPETDPGGRPGLTLHRWRMLDWRFLTPVLQPRHLGYGGSIDPELLGALQLLDPDTRPVGTGAGAPGAQFDVVLLREPDAGLFEQAAADVEPGGWVCAQVRRTAAGRGPHTVAGWKRLFRKHGFEDITVHWNVPGLDGPARLVPVDSPEAVRGTLALRQGVRFGLLKAVAGRVALGLRLFTVAIPAGTVTGRRAA